LKLQAKAGSTYCALDDDTAGEGLAIFFSQSAKDTARWRFDVYAKLNTGQVLLVGFFYVSPPSATDPIGELTRQVGAAVCPGAKSWTVIASPVGGPQAVVNETADITLISSKCCTAPVGVSRVSERYGYRANTTPGGGQSTQILFGMTVTGVSAFGLTGGGTIVLGSGNTITVADGAGANLEPKALIRLPTTTPSITFVNVNWILEFLESA